MDRFGSRWEKHWERVEANWRKRITPGDLVLIPGDHSWAMRLDEAAADLQWISDLPGTKVLIRGNHDYWWQSLGKIRTRFPGLTFLQNDSITVGDIGVCGTRGWNLPPRSGFVDAEDTKIYSRELERLKLSIASLPAHAERKVAMIHYPPLLPSHSESDFSRMLSAAAVDHCVYGHMHAGNNHRPVQGIHGGVDYHLVACDMVEFQPIELSWS
jgi:predicted phosphohydrolase